MTISNDHRLELELSVCRKVIQDILAAGYHIRVWDGEAWATNRIQDETTLVDALRSTDDDILCIYGTPDLCPVEEGKAFAKCGFVQFVYGNMPYEVIADNTDTDRINNLLKGGEALQEQIEKDLS